MENIPKKFREIEIWSCCGDDTGSNDIQRNILVSCCISASSGSFEFKNDPITTDQLQC